MSVETMLEFIKRVAEDDALRQSFALAVAGRSGDEAMSSIVEFAGRNGVVLTADDVARATAIVDSQKLTDDDLDLVPGGVRVQMQQNRERAASKTSFGSTVKTGPSWGSRTATSAGKRSQ